MKRSAIRRTPFNRNGVIAQSSFQRKAITVKKTTLSRSRPKSTPIRASAKDEECTLRFPCCNYRTDTTVWCHSNSHKDGKGMGQKSRDEEGCYGCFACHSFLDGGYANVAGWTREIVDRYFDLARERSQEILRRKNLL